MTRTPKSDPTSLAALPSLGVTSAKMLVEVGVHNPSVLRRLGPVKCYRRLRFQFGKQVTVNFIYALECACRNLHWRALEPERKVELKQWAQAIAAELSKGAHERPPKNDV